MQVYDLVPVGHGQSGGVGGAAGEDPPRLQGADEGVDALLDGHLHVGQAEFCGQKGGGEEEEETTATGTEVFSICFFTGCLYFYSLVFHHVI